MSINTKNKLLRQAAEGIEAQLIPETRAAYDKIVEAGMRVALNKGLDGMLPGLTKRGDPIRDAAQGAVNLVFLLRLQSKGRMPENAMVPASYSLMLQALAFIDEAKIAPVGQDELVRATHVWTNTLFDRAKITPDKLNQAGNQVQSILNDPAKLELLNLQTGYSRDPRAATPINMPMTMQQEARPNRKARRRARKKGRR